MDEKEATTKVIQERILRNQVIILDFLGAIYYNNDKFVQTGDLGNSIRNTNELLDELFVESESAE